MNLNEAIKTLARLAVQPIYREKPNEAQANVPPVEEYKCTHCKAEFKRLHDQQHPLEQVVIYNITSDDRDAYQDFRKNEPPTGDIAYATITIEPKYSGAGTGNIMDQLDKAGLRGGEDYVRLPVHRFSGQEQRYDQEYSERRDNSANAHPIVFVVLKENKVDLAQQATQLLDAELGAQSKTKSMNTANQHRHR